MRWLPADRFAWRILIFAAGFEIGLGALAWLVGLPFGIDVLETAHFSLHAVAGGAVATVPMVIALACILRWPIGPFADLVKKMRQFSQAFLAPCGICGLALISLCAGLGEELLTRGFVQTLALQHMPQFAALVVTGVVFGIMHPISPAYVVVAAIIGVYLGIVWTLPLPQPDLAAPVTAHALYDFVALLVLCKNPTQGEAVQD